MSIKNTGTISKLNKDRQAQTVSLNTDITELAALPGLQPYLRYLIFSPHEDITNGFCAGKRYPSSLKSAGHLRQS